MPLASLSWPPDCASGPSKPRAKICRRWRTGWRPQTAQGVTLHGDDVLGLPGALLEAGARSIVVSIPKASDTATAAFITAYHRRRAAGTQPLVAFCQTQSEMLAGGHKPHTWSGLVCYGVC
jgi:CHAT domain-containing protein